MYARNFYYAKMPYKWRRRGVEIMNNDVMFMMKYVSIIYFGADQMNGWSGNTVSGNFSNRYCETKMFFHLQRYYVDWMMCVAWHVLPVLSCMNMSEMLTRFGSGVCGDGDGASSKILVRK